MANTAGTKETTMFTERDYRERSFE